VNTPAPAPVTPEKPRGFADDTLEMVRLHREGMTYDEIALVMGRASGQVVGNAVRRAVKAGV
jgi:DNA-directed RNA polymerase specialized sigma24 family protein